MSLCVFLLILSHPVFIVSCIFRIILHDFVVIFVWLQTFHHDNTAVLLSIVQILHVSRTINKHLLVSYWYNLHCCCYSVDEG